MRALLAAIERPTSPRPLAIARIAIGAVAALQALEVAPVLARLNDPAVVRLPYADWVPRVSDLPAAVVVGVWVALAVLFSAGAFTSFSGLLLTVLLGALLASDQQLYSNHLYLLAILVGVLTAGRAGTALSIDAHRHGAPAMVPGWPVLLLRAQVSIVYAFAGLSKVNAVYLSGTVVASTLRRDGALAIPEAWRAQEWMMALAVISILAEIGLAIGLWIPRWRPSAFVLGVALHGAIAIWLLPTDQLIVFGMMMLPIYILFVDARPASHVVVWDDACTFCTSTIRWVRRLDWLHAMTFAPGSDDAVLRRYGISRHEADEAIQLVGHRGRSSGYAAMAGIFELLPLTFLVAPIMRIPPISSVGRRVYARVARQRRCRVVWPAGAAASTPDGPR
ncbi:MAG: HTTM domain-containing protein [Chloroflexota bacterium]